MEQSFHSYPEDLVCSDLPTHPLPGKEKILITGASGYIGGRLIGELLARGYQVRVMVRDKAFQYQNLWPDTEVIVADALKYGTLKAALDGVHTAYYLIHSLLRETPRFQNDNDIAARNFIRAAGENQVKRVIYLGCLGDIHSRESNPLHDRMRVEEELSRGSVPVTTLRSAIIIGSGSIYYDMIRHIVRKIPVINIPKWSNTLSQPIALHDAIKYLVGCLEQPETSGKAFDIGGRDILTYRQMVEIFARIMNKNPMFITVPFSGLPFYSYVASLITPVPAAIIRSLFEEMKYHLVCRNEEIRSLIPFETMSCRKAVERAFLREQQDKVYTRWSDSYPRNHSLALKLNELGKLPYRVSTYSIATEKSASALFESLCRIGGKEGWFHSNWMWSLRGLIDRLLMGVGSQRGRRSETNLKINDVIGFFRVEEIITNHRLLLRSEMKLPGKGWLEFLIVPEEGGRKNRLTINAYYDTNTFFGVVYWYLFLPFHDILFNGLIKQIEKRSR